MDIKLEAERAKIFFKGKTTRVKKKGMDALQYVAYKWNNACHQDNFFRAAIKLMGNTYADRIIYDRKEEELLRKFNTVFE